jgi:hypothetical protein
MANEILTAGNKAWRDYNTDGVPASGANPPSKADVRAFVKIVNDQVAANSLTSVDFGLVYGTLAALNADLAHSANTGATVQGDGTNDGLYVKSGVSGGGSWARVSTFSLSSINTKLVADEASMAETQRRQILNLRNSRLRLATIGDSVYSGNHFSNPSGLFITTQCRPINWLMGYYPNINHDVWVDLTNSRSFSGLDNCYSGTLTGSGALNTILQLPTIFPMTPDVVIEQSGINSITSTVTETSAATILAQKTTIANSVIASGIKKHIMRTLPPVSAAILPDPTIVTISIASPAVVTWTGHGRTVLDPTVPSTTGALPTGLTAGTQYYVKTVIDANTFTVSLTSGGTAINTTGTQSGVHTLTDPRRQKLLDVNTGIRSYAAATPNVILFDAYPIYDDGTGHPKAGYTTDGLHPTSLGSQHEATDAGGLVNLFQTLVRPVPQRHAQGASNLLPAFAGIAGTAGAAVTGQVLTGYTAAAITGGATITVAASVGSQSDGPASQVLAVTTHGGLSNEILGFTASTAIDLTPYANRWIRARCRVLLSASAMWRGFFVSGGFVGGLNPATTDVMINQTWPLDIESPPFKLGVTPGSVTPTIWFYIDASTTGVTGSISIFDLELMVVDNAMGLHNVLGG